MFCIASFSFTNVFYKSILPTLSKAIKISEESLVILSLSYFNSNGFLSIYAPEKVKIMVLYNGQALEVASNFLIPTKKQNPVLYHILNLKDKGA